MLIREAEEEAAKEREIEEAAKASAYPASFGFCYSFNSCRVLAFYP